MASPLRGLSNISPYNAASLAASQYWVNKNGATLRAARSFRASGFHHQFFLGVSNPPHRHNAWFYGSAANNDK